VTIGGGRTSIAVVAAAAVLTVAACGSSDHKRATKPASSTPTPLMDKQPVQEPAARHLTSPQVAAVLQRGQRLLDRAGTVGFGSDVDVGDVEVDTDGRVDFRKHRSDVSVSVLEPGGDGYEFRAVSRGDDVYGGYSEAFESPKCWYHFQIPRSTLNPRWRDHPALVLLRGARPRSGGSKSQLHLDVEVPLDAAVFSSFPRLADLYAGKLPADLMVPAVVDLHGVNDTSTADGELAGVRFEMADVLRVAKKHGIDLLSALSKGSGDEGEYRVVVSPIRNDADAKLARQISKVKVEMDYYSLGSPVPAPLPDPQQLIEGDPYSLDVPSTCGTSQNST
jgi:hypothetical protein